MPTFVLALLPLLGLVGSAIDYTNVTRVRSTLQQSLDAALIAGARDGSSNWVDTALGSFNANVQTNTVSTVSSSFSLDANRAYTGTSSAAVPMTFTQLLAFRRST